MAHTQLKAEELAGLGFGTQTESINKSNEQQSEGVVYNNPDLLDLVGKFAVADGYHGRRYGMVDSVHGEKLGFISGSEDEWEAQILAPEAVTILSDKAEVKKARESARHYIKSETDSLTWRLQRTSDEQKRAKLKRMLAILEHWVNIV